jgi:hypothetical protein
MKIAIPNEPSAYASRPLCEVDDLKNSCPNGEFVLDPDPDRGEEVGAVQTSGSPLSS